MERITEMHLMFKCESVIRSVSKSIVQMCLTFSTSPFFTLFFVHTHLKYNTKLVLFLSFYYTTISLSK